MKNLLALLGVVFITLVGLLVFTDYHNGQSYTTVAGYPVVHFAEEAQGVVAIGGTAYGVLAIGGFGVGVITLAGIGGGLILGTGQLAGGLFALGQAGLGLVLFLGQVGLGLNVAGQGGIGLRRWLQSNAHSKEYMLELKDELLELLALPGQRKRNES